MPHNTATVLPTPKVNLEAFGVSKNGFLPEELPLQRLSDPYYEVWERIIRELPTLLKTKSFRGKVDKLEVLSTLRLTSMREWQRAYLVLAFFTHSYIWESGGPSEVRTSISKLAAQDYLIANLLSNRYPFRFKFH